jgi:hypothetical protein
MTNHLQPGNLPSDQMTNPQPKDILETSHTLQLGSTPDCEEEELQPVLTPGCEEEEANKPLLEQNASLHDVVYNWSQETSIHGLPFAMNTNYKVWKRLLWLLLCLGSTAVLAWQIGALVRQYLDYDIETNTEVISPETLPFPEITVCNTNKFDSDYLSWEGIDYPANDEELELVAQDPLFFSTAFNGWEALLVWKPVVTQFGNCSVFRTDEQVSKPGRLGGLDFSYWLDQGVYTNDTLNAGLAIFITQHGTQINEQTPFTFVSPGGESNVRIQKTEYDRERKAPWALCFSQAPEYTQPKCRESCIYAAYHEKCKCRLLGDPGGMQLDYCGSTGDVDVDVDCQELDEEEVLRSCPQDCSRPPCQEELYSVSSTSLDFSQTYVNQIVDELTAEPNPIVGANQELVSSNYMSVSINYDIIRYEVLTESKAMSFSQLLAAIGGSMGLFLGISLISVLEVVADLGILRLIPRLWGDRRLNGVGSI